MSNHPFFDEKVIFDEYLWFLKILFGSKCSKNHSQFKLVWRKEILLSNLRFRKSHQIEPINYRIIWFLENNPSLLKAVEQHQAFLLMKQYEVRYFPYWLIYFRPHLGPIVRGQSRRDLLLTKGEELLNHSEAVLS